MAEKIVADTYGADRRQADAAFMAEAVDLARRATGRTSPNPMVGCVIVADGAIIGRGWHAGPGEPHAEVAALRDANQSGAGNPSVALKNATAYVTLEPCNHHGATGPCAEALINAGIGAVVYAQPDPNPIASGGHDHLARAGVEVRLLETEDARRLNAPWITGVRHKRSYILAKAAMSLDGRIATNAGESQWITSPAARAAGHHDRWSADAILVGAGTVIADDPSLTARPTGLPARSPLRIIVDSTARTSPGAKVFERPQDTDNPHTPGAILATTAQAPANRLKAFEAMGVEPIILPSDQNKRPDLYALAAHLHQRGVVKTMVEGGGGILGALFDQDLIDELAFFIAPKVIGGGAPAFAGMGVANLDDAARYTFDAPEMVGPDIMMRGWRRPQEG